jgi:exonuclease III
MLRFDGGIRTELLDRLARGGWLDTYRRLHPREPGFTLPSAMPRVRLDYLLAPERSSSRPRL